ncbi:MAG: anhydro-N-acetylmuramic acid kinase [Candidatus Eremiobacteraeota bacterium]|nr:anhydro-N-acetylmuramic acid kinase [Candidatus Eremiobacteraeota bacterium]
MIAVGIMSGTSLDGVDAALVEIMPSRCSYRIALLDFASRAYDAGVRAALQNVLPPNAGSVAAIAKLHRTLGAAFAETAGAVTKARRPDFIACHGQTVWHDGPASVTLQIGDPFVVRESLGATVCYDFRSADCAAGGHGAPLVAYVDALLLRSADEDRVALNLGGVANVTLLRRDAAPGDAVAFDTGPANMLLDAIVQERTGGRNAFDRDGSLAAAGRVQSGLLNAMLTDEYFAAPPPKTTGRERFGAHFLAKHGAVLAACSLEDAAATLAELTAVSIARALSAQNFRPARVVVAGGGARNPTLMARLSHHLAPAPLERSDLHGIPAHAKEAIAFAVLGYETLRGRAANVPRATAARRPAMLGAIAPHDLFALLARVERECDAAR